MESKAYNRQSSTTFRRISRFPGNFVLMPETVSTKTKAMLFSSKNLLLNCWFLLKLSIFILAEEEILIVFLQKAYYHYLAWDFFFILVTEDNLFVQQKFQHELKFFHNRFSNFLRRAFYLLNSTTAPTKWRPLKRASLGRTNSAKIQSKKSLRFRLLETSFNDDFGLY